MGTSAGMADIVRTTSDRPCMVAVDKIENQWCVDRDRGMEATWRLPGPEPDSCEVRVGLAQLEHRNLDSVDRKCMFLRVETLNLQLETLDR